MVKRMSKFTDIVNSRKLVYKKNLKGCSVKFVENIHDRIRKGDLVQLSKPITVFWAITDSCNLSCIYCYNKNKADELGLAEKLKLIDELYDMGIFEIILEGGEPTISKDFIDVVRYIKSKGMFITLITNGTNLTEVLMKSLVEVLDKNFDSIQVSLDGNEKHNDKQRGEKVYSKVINNLKMISERGYSWDNLIINCVVTNYNYCYLADMCRDLIEYTTVRKVHFSPVFNSKCLEVNNDKAYNEFFKIKSEFSSKIEISGYFVKDNELLKNREIWDYMCAAGSILGCCAGRSKLFISPDGGLYPCTFLRYKEFLIGKYPETTIKEAWNDLKNNNFIIESCRLSKEINEEHIYNEYCALNRLNKDL